MATKNLFEGAKWGDRYECRNGTEAIFLGIDCGMAQLLNCDEIPEGWIGSYELDGRADCDEEYDIVKRIGPWKTGNEKDKEI